MTKTRNNNERENKLRLSAIAPAAYHEGQAMNALATVLGAAFKGRSTGTWNAETNKPVPSPLYLAFYVEYKVGALAALLPQFGNMTEVDAIAGARLVVADSNRGEAANKALAAIRQRWSRALLRAGVETPRPKTEEAKANAAEAREEAKAKREEAKAKREGKSGQGEVEAPKPSAFEQAAAKFTPPSEKTRESEVAWLRLQLANMIREIEQFNVKAHKKGDAGMPVKIIGDLCDWQDVAKTWVF